MGFDPSADYPLGTERPELVTTPTGLKLDEVTLDALRAGRLSADDIRATRETLNKQAEIARAAGREPLAANLERAAELAGVPADTLLEIYTALRPNRSTRADLDAWAGRLASEFAAPLSSAFVREAAIVYAERGLLNDPTAEAI